MISAIDTHVHVYPAAIAGRAGDNLGRFYHFKVEESGTFDDLTADAAKAGVGGFVFLTAATSAKHVEKINEGAAALVREAKALGFAAAGFGGIHQDYPDFHGELLRCAAMGLKGFKLHPDLQEVNCDDGVLYPLYEEMEKAGMSLYLHVGDDRPENRYSSPERVSHIARDFPGMKIIAAHLGGYRAWEDARRYLWGKYENVYYDCSNSLQYFTAAAAVRNIRACGTDRVMFGSDYPSVSPVHAMEGFLSLGLAEDIAAAILHDNAVRILKM